MLASQYLALSIAAGSQLGSKSNALIVEVLANTRTNPMPTDLNTLDDWWNEGFDDHIAGSCDWYMDAEEIEDDHARWEWRKGWLAARDYKAAIARRRP